MINNDLKVPDYLAVFDLSHSVYATNRNSTKTSALVEVKTTQNDKIKLGKNFLDNHDVTNNYLCNVLFTYFVFQIISLDKIYKLFSRNAQNYIIFYTPRPKSNQHKRNYYS